MHSVLVLSVALLAACGRPSCKGLAIDPSMLKELRAECAAGWRTVGEGTCRVAAEAYRRRFFSGRTGLDEYTVLEALPPIPASFDEPGDEWAESDAPVVSATEATP